jgi:hypothetical protein
VLLDRPTKDALADERSAWVVIGMQKGFSRTFDDEPSRDARVCVRRNRYPFRRTRARSNRMPALPYIVRLISFRRLT